MSKINIKDGINSKTLMINKKLTIYEFSIFFIGLKIFLISSSSSFTKRQIDVTTIEKSINNELIKENIIPYLKKDLSSWNSLKVTKSPLELKTNNIIISKIKSVVKINLFINPLTNVWFFDILILSLIIIYFKYL